MATLVYILQRLWFPLSLLDLITTALLGMLVFVGVYAQLNRNVAEVERLRQLLGQARRGTFAYLQRETISVF